MIGHRRFHNWLVGALCGLLLALLGTWIVKVGRGDAERVEKLHKARQEMETILEKMEE